MKKSPNESTQAYDRAEMKDESCGDSFSKEFRIIMQQWNECKHVMERIYKDARRDKKFLRSKQWDSSVEAERSRRGLATSTIPLIRTYYNQKLGMALPGSIKFKVFNANPRPNNKDDQSIDAANLVLNGNLRYIDKISDAESVRNKLRKDQYGGGIGWLGVDYLESDNSRDGEIKISCPRHFDQVYIHPYYSMPDASDAEYSFYRMKMSLDSAIGMFGNKIKKCYEKQSDLIEISNFEECYDYVSSLDHVDTREWIDNQKKEVTIAYHHWRRKTEKKYYVFDGDEYNEQDWKDKKDELDSLGYKIQEDELEVVSKVGWRCEQRIICGWTILEESEFFINKIPWTPCFGYTVDDGESYAYHGIVHDAINLQETINWLDSQAAQKISEKHTKVFVPVGTFSDRNEPLIEEGGIQYYEYDNTADLSSGGAIQTVNSVDDGSTELQHLNARVQLLQEMMSTSNQNSQEQVINSAQQLSLTIRDRDVVREELDINYRQALRCHYKKVIEMILSVHDRDDMLAVVELDEDIERMGADRLLDNTASHNYSVDIEMAASGTVQKQQAQQFAQGLIGTGDPVRQNMGLIISAENSELPNKDKMAMSLYRSQFDQGAYSNIPSKALEEIIEEKRKNDQLQQSLQKLAQPLIEQGIQNFINSEEVQSKLQMSQLDVAKHELQVDKASLAKDKAIVQSNTAVQQDLLQAKQQEEQTKQDELRVLQEFVQLQQEVADLQREGNEISEELINSLIQIKIPTSFD